MRFLILMSIYLVGTLSCNSSDNYNENGRNFGSSNIVSVSGEELPIDADLVILWNRVSSRQDVEFFITGGGELLNGSFVIEPPSTVPPDAVAQGIVAVGLVLAYPKGMAPATGSYQSLDDSSPPVGIVNAHSIIYRASDPVATVQFSDPGGWWDEFNAGFECAKNIEAVSDQVFDTFEPIKCSEMVMRIGIVSEIFVVGGDWT